MNFFGFDIGGTGIKAVLCDQSFHVLESDTCPTPSSALEIEQCLLEIYQAMTGRFARPVTLGVGVAGMINPKNNSIVMSKNIPGLSGFQLGARLTKKTGVPVFVTNDASAALWGEWKLGIGSRYHSWCMITLGTGIGAAAMINGRILDGSTGKAMELGHLCIKPNGRRCSCGSRGCLELYASAKSITSIARQSIIKGMKTILSLHDLSAKAVFDAARKNDQLASSLCDGFTSALADGLCATAVLLNPEAFVIGGGLSRSHSVIIPDLKKKIEERLPLGLRGVIKMHASRLPGSAGAIGAAVYASERIVNK